MFFFFNITSIFNNHAHLIGIFFDKFGVFFSPMLGHCSISSVAVLTVNFSHAEWGSLAKSEYSLCSRPYRARILWILKKNSSLKKVTTLKITISFSFPNRNAEI